MIDRRLTRILSAGLVAAFAVVSFADSADAATKKRKVKRKTYTRTIIIREPGETRYIYRDRPVYYRTAPPRRYYQEPSYGYERPDYYYREPAPTYIAPRPTYVPPPVYHPRPAYVPPAPTYNPRPTYVPPPQHPLRRSPEIITRPEP